MRILISGSTGLVGSALIPSLAQKGHVITRLVRSPRHEGLYWNPDLGRLDASRLEGFNTVVHLAGESIGEGRWTPSKKQRLRDSRLKSTQLLVRTLSGLQQPPQTFICASAIGFYGDRGNETLIETSARGTGFLPELCRDWEEATAPARAQGIRVVNMRFGVILSAAGGALAKMLMPFKFGVGGVIGPGTQYTSWVALEDVVGAIEHTLNTSAMQGPVNVTAPESVTNRVFTKTLGNVLSRPTFFSMPAFAARLAFGEMADALLLASAKVEPAALQTSGYTFLCPQLQGALRHILGK